LRSYIQLIFVSVETTLLFVELGITMAVKFLLLLVQLHDLERLS